MLDNFNLVLLMGGFFRCGRDWSRAAGGLDQCFKVYLPVAGRAALEFDSGRFELEAGRVYLIGGHRLRRQACESQFDVYWLHFVPEAIYLRYLMDQLDPVVSWPQRNCGWPASGYREICQLFEQPFSAESRPRRDSAPSVACRIQGLLLTLIARALERIDEHSLRQFHPEYYQLKPALDYMQLHYRENPPLETLARCVHLAPNYFHRRFRQLFGVTPFNYMLARRLDRARHLLASTPQSVKQIAEDVGYDNALYFSRVFTANMQVTPSEWRAQTRNGQ